MTDPQRNTSIPANCGRADPPQIAAPELLEHIQAVFDVIGPYLDTTLEQFEIGFMRDMHPESEVAVWCSITRPGSPTTRSTWVTKCCRMRTRGSWLAPWSPFPLA